MASIALERPERNRCRSNQRYAHLIDSSLRAGVNAVGEMLKPQWKALWINSHCSQSVEFNNCFFALIYWASLDWLADDRSS